MNMLRIAGKTIGKIDRLMSRGINCLRIIRLRLVGAKVGNNVRAFGRIVIIGDASNLTIGSNCTLNEGVVINLKNTVTIGERVHISANVHLITAKLDKDNNMHRHLSAPVVIGSDVWLATSVIVSPGVTIGNDTVVGAHSLVLSDLGSGLFAGGIPAKKIKS